MEDLQASERADFCKWLDRYLGPVEKAFEADNYDRALGVASQQSGRWNKLLSMFDGSTLQNKPRLFNQINVLRSLLANAPGAATAKTPDGKSIVIARLPILDNEAPETRLGQGRRFPYLAAAILARRCEEFLIESDRPEAEIFPEINAAVQTALMLDDFGKTASRTFDSYFERLKNSWLTIEEKTKSAIADISDFKIDVQKSVESNQRIVKNVGVELTELLEQQKRAAQEREESWEEERKKAIDSLRAEVREFAKIETSIDLWRDKARGHTWAYGIFGFAFSAVLIFVAVSLFAGFGSDYIERLSKLPADHQFVGVALLLIPTLAMAWFLRFLARLTLQNLSLAHDARQRHAQISTYLRLLGDPSKPIGEQERILALAALFRPLPGQGSDDISPPTIADLLKEAQERVLKPKD